MEIGDEITIKVKVVDFDANPHGAAIKVAVNGFLYDSSDNKPFGERVSFWIHRLQRPKVIVE